MRNIMFLKGINVNVIDTIIKGSLAYIAHLLYILISQPIFFLYSDVFFHIYSDESLQNEAGRVILTS